jgi:hypothetical protein
MQALQQYPWEFLVAGLHRRATPWHPDRRAPPWPPLLPAKCKLSPLNRAWCHFVAL